MAEHKIEKWVSLLERLLTLIKPKFHNAITRTVVIFGLALSVESQINIFEAFAVAFYENIFGPSEYLRALFSTSSSPWIGVIFVIFGLFYNAAVTVGLELIQKYKAAAPVQPEFNFNLINSDGIPINSGDNLRGVICNHSIENIPENTSYSEYYQDKFRCESFNVGLNEKFFIRRSRYDDPTINKNFYRERAKFLRVWGGAEIICLCIENTGSSLATNVRIELAIGKKEGLSLSNENDLMPDLPKRETESSIFRTHQEYTKSPTYDIKQSHSDNTYFFEWKAGDLQAKHTCTSRTKIFFRCENECDLEVKIFCNELPSPIAKEYKISPSPKICTFDFSVLDKSEKDFLEYSDEKIMDGYLGRYYKKIREEYENSGEILLP